MTKKKKTDYLEQLKRVQADFENYKKRVEREHSTHKERANAELVGKLLECMDNLERALESAKKHKDEEKLMEGVELTYKHMKDILEKEGLEEIEAVNKQFDANEHDAMMTVPGKKDDIVAEELQKGYKFKDIIIRHSKVAVSKKE